MTKTMCECDKMILSDESVYGLGIVCLKCGLDAAHRVDEYMDFLFGPRPILTEEQRERLTKQVATIRALIGQPDPKEGESSNGYRR